MKSYIYIPRSEIRAWRHITVAMRVTPGRLTRKLFIRAWCSIFWLHPGLHPDGFEAKDSGWPPQLRPLAREAFRRRRAGRLTDLELYPYPAAKARLLAIRA